MTMIAVGCVTSGCKHKEREISRALDADTYR